MIRLDSTKKRADRHEKKVAKRLGGKVTRGSGNSVEKGDVRVGRKLRVECKTTLNNTYSLDPVIVEKIRSEAMMCGEVGVLNVQFEKSGLRYIVIAEDDFEEHCSLLKHG